MTTKQTAHTPGPWILRRHPDAFYIEVIGQIIAVTSRSYYASQQHYEANARLIAAAPDLLAAAEAALIALEATGTDPEFIEQERKERHAYALLRAAIAKGEQP